MQKLFHSHSYRLNNKKMGTDVLCRYSFYFIFYGSTPPHFDIEGTYSFCPDCLFVCFSFYKKLNPFPNKPWFLYVCSTSLLKILWEKKKLLVMSNFFFFHTVFHPFRELSTIFIKFKIAVCKLIQFGRV